MSSARLIDHYERKYAAAADSGIVPFTRRPRNRHEAAVAVMHRQFAGGDILELGGGDGLVARSLLASGLRFDSYVLTDLSNARATAAARSIDDPRFEGYCLDVSSDLGGLRLRRFDAILMVALIEHLIDPIDVMKKIHGLLKPGGFVYIDTPNIAKYTRRLKLMLGRFPSTASKDEGLITYSGEMVDLYDEGHLHYWTYRSMREMLIRCCGFRDVRPFPYWLGGSLGVPGRIGARLWPELFSEVAICARP